MSVPILVCPCGQRLKAPGLTPGRTGRCPKCGGMLTAPVQPVKARHDEEEERGFGYELDASTFSSSRENEPKTERQPRDGSPVATKKKKGTPPYATVLPQAHPEAWWPPDILYPLRGTAEAIGVIAALSVVFWIFTVLIPEYCLSLQRDAENLGARPMGYLVSLITALPALLLTPLAVIFTLQYFGRVVIARAMGDTISPRSPDRNFEGFLSGLQPWAIWLSISGALVLLLACSYTLSSGEEIQSPLLVAVLTFAGFPYFLMAFMMTFLHDDPWAAKPQAVLGAIFRLGASYAALCVTLASVAVLSILPFALIFLLRAKHFWVYIPACLLGWALVLWGAVVAMGTVGGYYYRHRETLHWHQERPRWGVAWKL